MSCSWCIAWMTEPAPRNSIALKNACVSRWNIADRIDANTCGDEHIAQLRTGRISNHALDVGLHQTHRGRKERRRAPMNVKRLRLWGKFNQRRHSANKETRPPSPWSPRGSAPKQVSGPPSRLAAMCAGTVAPIYPSHRQTAETQSGWPHSSPSTRRMRCFSPVAARSQRYRQSGCCPVIYSAKIPSAKPKSPTRLTTNALIAAALAVVCDSKTDQKVRGDATPSQPKNI